MFATDPTLLRTLLTTTLHEAITVREAALLTHEVALAARLARQIAALRRQLADLPTRPPSAAITRHPN